VTAPTEGKFARPERRWNCRRGTSIWGIRWNSCAKSTYLQLNTYGHLLAA